MGPSNAIAIDSMANANENAPAQNFNTMGPTAVTQFLTATLVGHSSSTYVCILSHSRISLFPSLFLVEKHAKHQERRILKTLQPGNVYIEENQGLGAAVLANSKG